ncbi:MAG TPA: D-glycero-beta-D-manno-heptose-7-phosphate kinase [Bacteroidota bacterium]|nr:D-glycero-beta-D-manno-heptose-7-phosphate kinase [Bacteroidota bacterium]
MVDFTRQKLDKLFRAFKGKRIAVVGDLMLDRYYWGSVNRISPEAPVPVVEVSEESTRLGGAANVANNIASLGGIPILVGVVGDDEDGEALKGIVKKAGFPTTGIVTDKSRPTTLKTRVIAHSQHVVRIDHEVRSEVGPDVQKKISTILRNEGKSLDAIILQDYNKGVLTKHVIRQTIQFARTHGKIVTVDPKFNNFFDFENVTVFKPNRKETEEALGIRLTTDEDAEAAGRDLLARLKAENVLLTLGERGMILLERSGEKTHVPTAARRVADVSGAGDTVVSTLTIALAAGSTMKEAATLANHAGGIVCGEVGIVPIDRQRLLDGVLERSNHSGD